MKPFADCPNCSLPALGVYRRPTVFRAWRSSFKRKADHWIISSCCQASRDVLRFAPLSADELALQIEKWSTARLAYGTPDKHAALAARL